MSCEPDLTIRVTTTVDGESGSLRAAVDQANRANAPVRIEVPTGTYELTRCAEDGDNSGGDLDLTTNANVRIEAAGANAVIRQTCPDRVLEAHGSGVVSIVGVTLSGGREESAVDGDGGGIKGGSVVLSRVTLSDNVAARGGGIACSTLTADQIVVTGNRALERGGGVFVTTKAVVQRADVSENVARLGAGLAAGEELVISHSRVADNRASTESWPGTGPDGDEMGGVGIWAPSVVGDALTVAGNRVEMCSHVLPELPKLYGRGAGIRAERVSLVNSTISGNSGPPNCYFENLFAPVAGIGIYAAEVELDHCTVVGNEGGETIEAPRLTSRSSVLIAGSYADVCKSPVVAQGTYNWFDDASCNITGMGNRLAPPSNFLLGPLRDNGGPVPTHAPFLGSPLIDAVPTHSCVITSDARGVTRPQGARLRCDMGAVEVEQPSEIGAANLGIGFSVAPTTVVAGVNATWQLTLHNYGPNPSAPAVWLDVQGVDVQSLTATEDGVCHVQSPVGCTFAVLQPGSSAVITLTASSVWPASTVTVGATLSGPSLQPPFTDDQASSTSVGTADGLLRPAITSRGDVVTVDLLSIDPEKPVVSYQSGLIWPPGPTIIRVTFHAADGVSADSGTIFGNSDYVPGSFPASETPFYSTRFALTFAGEPPALLGELEVHPGLNRLDGPRMIPVYYQPAPSPAD